MMIFIRTVAEMDVIELHRPSTVDSLIGSLVSGTSSPSLRNSKTRSAAAAVCCSTLEMLASWVIGWVKERMYWMKAWISPMVMALRTAR